jgi:hypothetical protein
VVEGVLERPRAAEDALPRDLPSLGLLLLGFGALVALLVPERGVADGAELGVISRAMGAAGPELAKPLEGPLPVAFVAACLRLTARHGLVVARLGSASLVGAAVAATFVATARLAGRRAAVFAAIVVLTSPLTVSLAGTVAPDAATLGFGGVAFSAAVLVAHGELSPRRKVAWAIAGLVALVGGIATRGVLLGALPALAPLLVPHEGRSRWSHVSLVGLVGVVGVLLLPKVEGSATTFEAPLVRLGHVLFPWSLFVPLVVAGLVRERSGPRRALASSVLVSFGVAVLADLLATRAGASFVPVWPTLLAAGVGLGASEPRGVRPSALVAAAAVTVLLGRDALSFPERALAPYSGVPLPASVIPRLGLVVPLVTGLAVLGMVGHVVLRRAGRGSAAGVFLVAAGAISAIVLVLGHHRAVAMATSSSSVVASYVARKTSRSRLGVLDVPRAHLGALGVSADAELSSAEGAARWLVDDPSRWLVVRRERRVEVSAAFRALVGRNVPEVSDGPEGALLLLTAAPSSRDRRPSPLDSVVTSRLPEGFTPLAASFDIPVDAVGIRLRDGRGWAVTALRPGESGIVEIAYRARAAVPPGYCSFVHVDTMPLRATHEDSLIADYPMRYWREGDVVVVAHPFTVPRGARPSLADVTFGLGVLPCVDDRRAHVTVGNHKANRVVGGALHVR